jgi:hypothetical protein
MVARLFQPFGGGMPKGLQKPGFSSRIHDRMLGAWHHATLKRP